MSKEDEDACQAVGDLLEDEGIEVLLNARAKRVTGKSGESVSIVVAQNGTEKTLTGSHILVAAGRTPNTEGLGLQLAGVELTDRGYIKTNERLQTTAPGVWAIGEVAGSPQFTHISIDDFRVVHSNLTGGNRVTTGRQVPYCLFTDPELAHIGLHETDLRAQAIPYRLFKVPMETNLRARTLSETRGFVKALVAADSDRILGFTVFGVSAGEIMAPVQVADRRTTLYRAARRSPGSPHLARGPHSTVFVDSVAPKRDSRDRHLNPIIPRFGSHDKPAFGLSRVPPHVRRGSIREPLFNRDAMVDRPLGVRQLCRRFGRCFPAEEIALRRSSLRRRRL